MYFYNIKCFMFFGLKNKPRSINEDFKAVF